MSLGQKLGIENPDSGLLSQKAIINQEKVQNLGLTTEPSRKPKTNNQELLRNNLKLKLKYEVNLRFETQVNEKPKNERLNSRFTLIGPVYSDAFDLFLVQQHFLKRFVLQILKIRYVHMCVAEQVEEALAKLPTTKPWTVNQIPESSVKNNSIFTNFCFIPRLK